MNMDNNNTNKKMMGSHLNNENLYSKTLLVRLSNSKSEEKFKSINISVDYQTTTVPTHKTELIIKLTDELDPFFLYSLYMSEEDYQTLKTQQGLLVDFGAFGQKFIDLLNLCEKDERCDNPKFQLQLYTKEPLPFDHNNAYLNVIEINPFKHLCHLQLTFMPGNDSDVKKYLAHCLQGLRENYMKLSKEYDENKMNLSQRLESTQQLLSQKSSDLDRLRIEIDTQTERLNTKYMQELNFEKEKSLQNQYSTQQKYEKEKKDLEANFTKQQKQLEQRLNELETSNKDLVDKKYKNEVQLQELRSKHQSLQEEYNVLKQDLTTIRKQNTSLDSELHSNEKTVNHLRTRIAVLEQEVKDKDELVTRTTELLNNEQTVRKQQEEVSNERGQEIKKLHGSLKHVSSELMKGNEIINKLQAKLRACNNKMKLKNEILNQQEKVVLEKEKEIGEMKSELKNLQETTKTLSDENKDLKNSLNKKTQELEEAAKLLKKDENIINWLNKQITEFNLNNNNTGNTNLLSTAPGMLQFKPYGTLSAPTTGGLTSTAVTTTVPSLNNTRATNGMINNSIDFMNGTTGTTNNGILRSASLNKNFNTSNDLLHERQQYQQQQHPVIITTTSNNNYLKNLNSSSSSSSSSAVMTTAQQQHQQSSTTGSRLDPKYFQPQTTSDSLSIKTRGLNNLTSSSSATVAADSSKLSTTTTTASTNNAVRINKQLVQPPVGNGVPLQQISPNSGYTNQQMAAATAAANSYAALISSKSTPTLASAYFPTN